MMERSCIKLMLLMIFSGLSTDARHICNNSIVYDSVAILAEVNAKPDEPIAQEFMHLMDASKPTSCLPFGNSSQIHEIHLDGVDPFSARCESRLAGPGWMLIQRRYNGRVEFYRNWTEYRNGFGDLNGEFWLGLEKVHRLTKNRPHEILLYFVNFRKNKSFAIQDNFEIAGEDDDYKILSAGSPFGNTWMALEQEVKFTTYDRKNFDGNDSDENIAEFLHGAWWWKFPTHNVNGRFYRRPTKRFDAIWSHGFNNSALSVTYIRSTFILIRPKLTKNSYFGGSQEYVSWKCETGSDQSTGSDDYTDDGN